MAHAGSAERAEAVKMLHSIRQLRERHTTSSPQLMTTVYHSLALLHTVLADHSKVGEGGGATLH